MRPEPSFARSLVAWGNACLLGALPRDSFDAYVLRAKPVRALSFGDGAQRWSDSASWFASVLQRHGAAARLALDASSPAGCEAVVACAEPSFESWQQSWTRIASAKSAPWFDATFARGADRASAPPPGRTVDVALSDLVQPLDGLVQLSRRANLGGWGSYFSRALEIANGERQAEIESPLPPTAPAAAHRLALAAMLSDAFGGMGSWNDFEPLEDAASESDRNRWSSDLYNAIRGALISTAHV